MAEKLLINVAHEETRVALVESGRLSNFEIVTSRADNNKGNIYKGIVHRVNASLQAAFVDYGAEKQGFLPLGELIPELYPKGQANKKLPIQDILHQGQEIMVQVVKDEIGQKGAGLTTAISVAGRSLALEANSDKAGISRRVSDEERKRLKKEMNQLDVPDGHGIIMRTAAAEQDSGTIKDNKKYVEQLLAKAHERFRNQKGPGLVHQERSLPLRAIRDYVSSSVDEILIDDRETYEEVRNFCIVVAPEFVNRIKYYDDPRPLFSRFQVEDQIDDIFARRIDLPSGGSIVIDQTEALVAIDVNSGRVKTDDIEDTATKTNLEAAAEIARQLKIRDRGGLIVVDFIDMRERDNIKRVEDAVRDAFRSDKAKVKFTKISELGLMEISRQRLQGSVMRGSFTPCPACGGSGQIRSVESSALYLLRRMKETLLRGNHQHLEARMPVEIANYLLNRKRRELLDLERQTGTSIDVRAEGSCPPMQSYFELISRTTQQSRRAKRVLQTIDLVRSEVERRELEDGEEITIEQAVSEEAEASVFAEARAGLDAQNRALEAEMARAKEIERAQKEADESLRREAELKAQKELLLAEAEKIRAMEDARWKGMSIWGRLKAWLGGGLPPLQLAEEKEARADKPERAERERDRDRDDRRRRRDRDERDEKRRKRDRGEEDGEAKKSERKDGERKDERRDGERKDGERKDGERRHGDKHERHDKQDKKERPERDSELLEGGGAVAGDADGKKKRRRRRRGKGGDEGDAGGEGRGERPERGERAERQAGEQRGERPERQPGEQRGERPERQGGEQRGERPERQAGDQRGERPERPAGDQRQGDRRGDRQGRDQRAERGDRQGDGREPRPPREPRPALPPREPAVELTAAEAMKIVVATPPAPVVTASEVAVEAPAPTPKVPKFGAIDLRGGTPKVIAPRVTPITTEAPAPIVEAPKAEVPKAEAPQVAAPPVEAARSEAETAKTEAPKAETTRPVLPPPASRSTSRIDLRSDKSGEPKAEPEAKATRADKADKAEKPTADKAATDKAEVPKAPEAPKAIEPETDAEAEGEEAEGEEGDGTEAGKARRRGRGRRGGRGRTRREGEGEAAAAPDAPKE